MATAVLALEKKKGRNVEELEGFKQIENVFAPLMTKAGSWDEHNKGL